MPFRRRYNKRPASAYRSRHSRYYRRQKYPIRRTRFKPLTYTFSRWGDSRYLEFDNQGAIGWPVYTNNYAAQWWRTLYTLQQMPGFTEFVSLFRWYKIQTVKTRITVGWQGGDNTQLQLAVVAPALPGTVNRGMPDWIMASLIDKSNQFDVNAQGAQDGLQNAKQYSSFRFHKSDKAVWRTCHPKPLWVIQNVAGVQTGAMQLPESRGWLTTDQPNVPHYSINWAIQPNFPLNGTMPDRWGVGIRYETKYTVTFKGVR